MLGLIVMVVNDHRLHLSITQAALLRRLLELHSLGNQLSDDGIDELLAIKEELGISDL